MTGVPTGSDTTTIGTVSTVQNAMKAFVFALLAVGAVADSKFNVKPDNNPFGKCPEVNGEKPTYLMDMNNRGIFYECDAGVPYVQKCPPGLVFNPDLEVCDFPCRNCEPYGPVGTCKNAGIFFLRYLRDGVNISVFYVCNLGKAVRYNCPEGKIYSTRFKICLDAA